MKDEGQATIEYLLLIGVIVSFGFVVFKSDAFKNFMGEESFGNIKTQIEYSYRHGLELKIPGSENNSNYVDRHDSYYQGNTETRFFSSLEEYPQP